MTDWFLRHPSALTAGMIALIVAAIVAGVSGIINAHGGARILAAGLFVVMAALGFAGCLGHWRRLARQDKLILDPGMQAETARRGFALGFPLAAALLILTGILESAGLESAIAGFAVGLFSAVTVARSRMDHLRASSQGSPAER
jgi:hypothetical protein